MAVLRTSKEKGSQPVRPRVIILEPHGNRHGILIVKHSLRQGNKCAAVFITARQ